VFLLHDVFSYDYDETAGIVGRSAATCRQLAHRARQHMDAERPRFEVEAAQRNELAARFFDAVGRGDMEGLVDLLAADVEVHGDSGGVPPSWPRPIIGRDKVSRLLISLGEQIGRLGGSLKSVEVNGQPGALVQAPDGSLVNVFSLDIADGQIQMIRSVINRDKLRHLGPLADVAGLREQLRE